MGEGYSVGELFLNGEMYGSWLVNWSSSNRQPCCGREGDGGVTRSRMDQLASGISKYLDLRK